MSERKGQIGADQHAEYERLEGVGVALENAREHDRPHQWLHWKTKATRLGSRPFGISCGSAPKGSTPFVRQGGRAALYGSTIFLSRSTTCAGAEKALSTKRWTFSPLCGAISILSRSASAKSSRSFSAALNASRRILICSAGTPGGAM